MYLFSKNCWRCDLKSNKKPEGEKGHKRRVQYRNQMRGKGIRRSQQRSKKDRCAPDIESNSPDRSNVIQSTFI